MISSDRLKGITPFVCAVESGSFTAAAEKLHLSNSAISKSIARLEARLECRLFDRTTRSLALTDAGLAFYETCSRVLNDLAQAESVLAAQRILPSGRLRIALPHSFGRLQVVPILNQFCREHPQVQLSVTFSDRFVDLIDENIDIAVRIGGSADYPASVGYRYVGSEQLTLCAAPDYLKQHGKPDSLDDLAAHRCVVYSYADGSTMPWSFVSPEGRIVARQFSYRMAVGDGEALLSATIAGMGIAQIATWLAKDNIASGELWPLLESQNCDGLPLYLIWPRKKQLTPKVDALLQALSQLSIR